MRLLSNKTGRVVALALMLVASIVVGVTRWAGANPTGFTVARTSAADFFVDTTITPKLLSSYTAYLITNTSGNPQNDVYVKIGNFTGTGNVISLGAGASNKYKIGNMANGASSPAFFYLTATGATANVQNHDISVYLGDPDNGGVIQGTAQTFGLTTVQDTIKAAANKITGGSVSAGSSLKLGDTFTVSVSGQSGTLGAGPGGTVPIQQLAFAGPSVLATFPAGAFKLLSTNLAFDAGSPATVANSLATTRSASSSVNYTMTYTFQAVDFTATSTAVNPYVYINSGTQVKHTDPGTFSGLPAIPAVTQGLTLTLTANPSTAGPGGTITYTLTATNNGGAQVNLSNFVVTLDPAFITAGGTYNNGSSTFNAGAITDPAISGAGNNILTFTNGAPYAIPAGGNRKLVFTVTVPGSAGGPYATTATAANADFPNTTPAQTASATNVSVAALSTPNITAISPSPIAPGGTVTITGSGFTGVNAIDFCGTPCTSFTVNNDGSITATVPNGVTAGSCNVTVTNSAGTSNAVPVTITAPLLLNSVTPDNGPAGTTVTLAGTGFTGTTAVTFGTVPATSFTVNNDGSITATVPPGAGSTVNVTANGATSNSLPFGAPVITSLSPNSALPGTQITINGYGFTGATGVMFGNTPATTFTVNNDGSITVTVPNNPGSFVTVTTPRGTSNQAPFTVPGAPVITSLSPAAGPAGTTVTISGSNFTGATAVLFGNVPATSYTVNNDGTITCVVPANAGPYVTVTNPTGTSNQAPFGGPVITALSPNPAAPGTTILISGTNLAGATGVMFGNVPATSFVVNPNGTISAVVPAGAGPYVTVTTPQGTSNQAPFSLPGAPVVTSFTPTTGGAGATVTVTGLNFTGATGVTIGGTPVASFVVVSPTTIQLVTASGTTGPIQVTTPAGVGQSANPYVFINISGDVVPTVPGGGASTSDGSGNLSLSPFQIRNTGTTTQFLLQVTIGVDNPTLFSQGTLVATAASGSRTTTLTQISASNTFVFSSPLLLQPGEAANLSLTLITVKASGSGNSPVTVVSLLLPLLLIPRRSRKLALMLVFTGYLTLGLVGCGGGGGGVNGQRDGSYNVNNGAAGVANVNLTQIVGKGPNNEPVIYTNLPQHLYTITIQ